MVVSNANHNYNKYGIADSSTSTKIGMLVIIQMHDSTGLNVYIIPVVTALVQFRHP